MSSHTNPELYKLCKEVYEKTGWFGTDEHIRTEFPTPRTVHSNGKPYEIKDKLTNIPLYTSDYLLEKLYAYKPSMFVMDDGSWCVMPTDKLADHRASVVLARNADIPLKALLKLCLALSAAGELS